MEIDPFDKMQSKLSTSFGRKEVFIGFPHSTSCIYQIFPHLLVVEFGSQMFEYENIQFDFVDALGGFERVGAQIGMSDIRIQIHSHTCTYSLAHMVSVCLGLRLSVCLCVCSYLPVCLFIGWMCLCLCLW